MHDQTSDVRISLGSFKSEPAKDGAEKMVTWETWTYIVMAKGGRNKIPELLPGIDLHGNVLGQFLVGWRDCSMVKSSWCSWRRSRVNSQHPHLVAYSIGSHTHFCPLWVASCRWYTHTHTQYTYTLMLCWLVLVNLTQPRHSWEEETSVEITPPSSWPVDKSVDHFLD